MNFSNSGTAHQGNNRDLGKLSRSNLGHYPGRDSTRLRGGVMKKRRNLSLQAIGYSLQDFDF
jgi:hypothetical protein